MTGNRHILVGAVLSGILCGLGCPASFLPVTAPLAWVWAIPLMLCTRRASTWQLIWGALCAGLLGALGTTTGVGFALGYVAPLYYLAAGVFYALPWLAFALPRLWLGHDRALWMLPALAALSEWTLYKFELGWNQLAGSQASAVHLVQFVDLFGEQSITFWLTLINVLVYREMIRNVGSTLRMRRLAVVFAVMLGVPAAYSFYRLHREYGSGSPLEILLVQANADSRQDRPENWKLQMLQKHLAITDAAVALSKPDLIAWPEVAVPYVLGRRSPLRETLAKAVADWGTPFVTGAFDDARVTSPARQVFTSADVANGSFLFTPGPPGAGPELVRVAQPYHKRRMVPFVEAEPFGIRAEWLQALRVRLRRPAVLEQGHNLRTFSYRADNGQMVSFATPICYEDLYGNDLAEFVRKGAQFFIVLTNDSWFGTWETAYSHAALARLRAIETRRPVAQAASTGWSLLIDAKGQIVTAAPWWQTATVRAKLQPNDGYTPYTLHPNLFAGLCAVWLAGCLTFLLRRKVAT